MRLKDLKEHVRRTLYDSKNLLEASLISPYINNQTYLVFSIIKIYDIFASQLAIISLLYKK